MKYTLMHKNVCAADIEVDTENGRFVSLGEVYRPEHMPPGVYHEDEKDIYRLEGWWNSRSIPKTRTGIEQFLRENGIQGTEILTLKSLGLSLSDQYWIRPYDTQLDWRKINFFDNNFSDAMGILLFDRKHSDDAVDLMSPESTSNGWLRKRWTVINGRRYLIKGGSGFMQEPFNEVIASEIAERLGFYHTEYTLLFTASHQPVCLCEDFIDGDTELISAFYVNSILPLESGESKYDHFVRCCQYLNIPNYAKSLDEMLILDFIIANQDRHLGNFGVIRNADTLEYLGFAPIFDSGTSLRYDTPTVMIDPDIDIEAQPFARMHSEQIRFVGNMDIYRAERLADISDTIGKLICGRTEYMHKSRTDKIIDVITSRIDMLSIIV